MHHPIGAISPSWYLPISPGLNAIYRGFGNNLYDRLNQTCLTILAGLVFSISVVNLTLMGVSFYYIATRALDLITVILPPALPATLSIGVSAAVNRLKRQRILCVDTSKINVLSKVDRICFDKTGTLTEEGLKILHVLCWNSKELSVYEKGPSIFERLKHDSPNFYRLMCLCHRLKDYAGQVVGDTLDVEVFRCTQTNFPSNCEQQSKVRFCNAENWSVIADFSFSHDLRRMSVLAEEKQSKVPFVFTKGSPEAIKRICQADTSKQFPEWCALTLYSSWKFWWNTWKSCQ